MLWKVSCHDIMSIIFVQQCGPVITQVNIIFFNEVKRSLTR